MKQAINVIRLIFLFALAASACSATPETAAISASASVAATESPTATATAALAQHISLPVFPGAEGFGATTVAGRGGEIIRVTTLAASGPGSLRAALAAPMPRTILFEVGGTIELTRPLKIENPFVTVAGQSAPSPGITLAGAGLTISTHDVLVQHIRVRVGDRPEGEDPGSRDGIEIVGHPQGRTRVYNVFIDHCSVSWAVDEGVSTLYPNVSDVTVRNCIVSENLANSIHPKGEHSMGMLVGNDTQRIAVIGNLFAHNMQRNPLIKGNVSAVVADNVIYNTGRQGIHMIDDLDSAPTIATIAGNVILPGPNSSGKPAIAVQAGTPPGSLFFIVDNWAPGVTDDPWSIVGVDVPFNPRAANAPLWVFPMTYRPSWQTQNWVLATAGARPADRDAVDARIVSEVQTGGGQIIDSQWQVGGWPDLPTVSRRLTLPNDPNGDRDGDGYTNLEEWLHVLAAQVEGR